MRMTLYSFSSWIHARIDRHTTDIRNIKLHRLASQVEYRLIAFL